MKKSIFLILFLSAVLSISAQSTGKYQIKFLEINKKNSDYAVGLLDDNKLIYTSASEKPKSSKRNYNPRKTLYIGEINSDGEIVNATRAIKKIDSRFNQLGVAYSKDKKTVYLSRNIYDKKKSRQKSEKNKRLVLYKASVDADGYFRNITELPFNMDGISSGYPVLNKDNTKLYFVSDRLPSMGGTDIFVVDIKKDGTYGKPRNLGNNVNTSGKETTPFITEDNILYFSSDGHPGKGLLDIYSVKVFESSTSEISQLASPINSGNDDFAYIINKDENLGFFTSNRLQGKDFNDLYSFTLEKEKKSEECFISVDGKVKDSDTKNVISGATVELFDLNGQLLESLSTYSDGTYKFEVSCAKEYKIIASNDNYIDDEKRIEILEENYHSALHANLNLSKIKVEKAAPVIASLQPIYYGFDEATITAEAANEMDRIVEIMEENPSLVLEASSFTDSRGSNSYNLKLSQRRLRSALDYLMEKGIDGTRIKGSAYGEEKLVNQCVNGIECDEHAHELNRRTEFNFASVKVKSIPKKQSKTRKATSKTTVKEPVKKEVNVVKEKPKKIESTEKVNTTTEEPKEKELAEVKKSEPQLRSVNKAENYIEDQKAKIIDILTALENKYEKVIAENKSVSDIAVVEKNKVTEFKKTVLEMENTGWSNIINYKIEIKNFNRTYEELLNGNVKVKERSRENGNSNNGENKTADFSFKDQGKVDKNLKVKEIQVTAIKVSSKGKYIPTSNPKQTDIIKVSFKVNQNRNASPGEKDVHVVVQDPKGQVSNAIGVFTDKKSNEEKKFTDHTIIDYEDRDVNVVLFIDKKSKTYQKGNYPIDLFLEGELVASTNLSLENY